MKIARSGNFGIIDTGSGIYTFRMGAARQGWPSAPGTAPAGFAGGLSAYTRRRISCCGKYIIPMGDNNDLPQQVARLLDRFYAGEGIMGKIAGLQWGEGPRLYVDAVDQQQNRFYRQWTVDDDIQRELEAWQWQTFLHHCLVDLTHMQGFFVKFIRSRGPRIGQPGRIVRLEHVPYHRCRLVYPPDGQTDPQEIMVGDFPFPDPRYTFTYPVFDPRDPMRHRVSMAYYNIYSFCKDFMSSPRFVGAFEWLELAGDLAPLLRSYNANATAISLHIESPQKYWDDAEARIKQICERTGETYSPKMLEDFKNAAMEKFAGNISGQENVGKYMHTTKYWNDEANQFEGWKVEPVDKKVKDYIDAQISIANKADAAATSGFGLDPVLSNLIIENKLSSGSEKLYSLKVYNASETAIPDMILCTPMQQYLQANHPGTPLKVGLYRTIVEAEQNISPQSRTRNNI